MAWRGVACAKCCCSSQSLTSIEGPARGLVVYFNYVKIYIFILLLPVEDLFSYGHYIYRYSDETHTHFAVFILAHFTDKFPIFCCCCLMCHVTSVTPWRQADSLCLHCENNTSKFYILFVNRAGMPKGNWTRGSSHHRQASARRPQHARLLAAILVLGLTLSLILGKCT